MGSPALTVPWSATLVMVTTAQLTMIGIGPALGLPSLLVVAEAVLLTVPQVAGVVGEVMWTWTEAEGARSTGPKCRPPAVMVLFPKDPAASMLHPRPPFVARPSETVTLRAMPAPVL